MRGRWIQLGVLALVALGAAAAFHLRKEPARGAPPPSPSPVRALHEDFDRPTLDPQAWIETSEGDFKEKTVDLFKSRLRLRCSTIGTKDDTVKFLGVRSAAPVSLDRPTRVAADFDWNQQANGCYLTGSLVLSPEATGGNPLLGPDWVRVEYVGVPPGKLGRMQVVARTSGRERYLFMEGWPEQGREGRALGIQHLELSIKDGGIEIFENGRSVFALPEKIVQFASAHLYLQMSSHSNYPVREVFWDAVRVFPGD